MADTKIRFSIGAIFSGEGFKKAETAVKTTANTVKGATEKFGALAGEMDGLGGVAGKAAGTVGKLAGAFQMLGPLGLVAVAAMEGINAYAKQMQKEVDEFAAKVKENADRVDERLKTRLESRLASVRDALAQVRDVAKESAKAFEEMTANEAKISSAGAATASAGAMQKIAKMQWEAAVEQMKTDDEAAKAMIAAKWKVAIQREKEASANADANAKEDAAAKANEAAFQRSVMAADRLAQAREALKVATEKEEEVALVDSSKTKEFTKNREEAEKIVREAESEHAKAIADLRVSEEALKQATANAETVRMNGQTATAELEQAERNLKRKTDEEAAAREAASKRQASGFATANELSAQLREREKSNDALIKKMDEEIKAQGELVQAIKDAQESARRGMEADAKHTTGSFGPYKYHTDENGNIEDFEDFQRAQRFSGRADRDGQAQQRHNESLEKQMNNIRDKGDKASEGEKKRLDQWDKFQKQRKDADAEAAKKQQMEKDRDEAVKKMQEDVKSIKEKIKEALEVK